MDYYDYFFPPIVWTHNWKPGLSFKRNGCKVHWNKGVNPLDIACRHQHTNHDTGEYELIYGKLNNTATGFVTSIFKTTIGHVTIPILYIPILFATLKTTLTSR